MSSAVRSGRSGRSTMSALWPWRSAQSAPVRNEAERPVAASSTLTVERCGCARSRSASARRGRSGGRVTRTSCPRPSAITTRSRRRGAPRTSSSNLSRPRIRDEAPAAGMRMSTSAMPSADHVHPQFQPAPCLLRQVAAEMAVDQPENPDDHQREQDEIACKDRVGHERVEGLVGEVIGVIERIAALLPGREAREEDQRRGVKEKDRLVGVGGPGEAQHGGPDDPAKPRHAGEAVSIGGLDIALGDGTQRAVEDFPGIGGGVEKEHDQRAEPCRGEGVEDRRDGFQGQEQEIGEKELDEERRAAKDEDEPFRRFAECRVLRALAKRHERGEEKPRQKGDHAEIDIPDHPRPNQGEMLAQRIAVAREQAFAVAERAEGIILNGLPATHAACLIWRDEYLGYILITRIIGVALWVFFLG